MLKKSVLWIIIILLLGTLIAAPALAQGYSSGEAGRVIFGDNLTLEDGDFIDGDVVMFGGSLTLEAGSQVDGDVVIFGGSATVDGDVSGDVAVIGGSVRVESEATVKGDIVTLGGSTQVDESASVSGTIAEGPDFKLGEKGFSFSVPSPPISPEAPAPPSPPEVPAPPNVTVETGNSFLRGVGRFFGDGISDIFAALMVAGLGLLVIMFFPAHVKVVEDAARTATPTSFVVGMVTVFAAVALIFVLALFFWLILPVCGIIFVAIALTVAWLMGITVVGKFFGERIFAAFNTPARTDIATTVLGVAVLLLIIRMPFIDQIPWLGWMFGVVGGGIGFLATATGLGAVVLSRFGTQPYVPVATAPATSSMTLFDAPQTPPAPMDDAPADDQAIDPPDADSK